MKWHLKYIVLGLLLGIAVFYAGIWWVTSKFVSPVTQAVNWPANLTVNREDVSFHSRDQYLLKGWFFAQPDSTTAIVLLHGISMDRTQMLDRAVWLHSLGYNVLAYDARGCGESDPANRSFGYRESSDFLGAIDWLQSRGIKQIGCIGFSQGAATILLSIDDLPQSVHAIVAESCYTNLRTSANNHIKFWAGYLAPEFQAVVVPILNYRLGANMKTISPLQEIAKLRVPIYLIGGAADERAPPSGIRQLYDAAPGKKDLWFVPRARHGDFYACAPDEYKQRVGTFLKENLP